MISKRPTRGMMSTRGRGEEKLDIPETVCASFYGTKCQDKPLPTAYCPLQRRRPLPGGTCGVVSSGAWTFGVAGVQTSSDPCVHSWHRNRQPARVTVAPRSSFFVHWHPRRYRSIFVLAQKAGTILLSGPLLAIASLGTPRGHSLSVGPLQQRCEARKHMDTHPRTLSVSRYCASGQTALGDRRFRT